MSLRSLAFQTLFLGAVLHTSPAGAVKTDTENRRPAPAPARAYSWFAGTVAVEKEITWRVYSRGPGVGESRIEAHLGDPPMHEVRKSLLEEARRLVGNRALILDVRADAPQMVGYERPLISGREALTRNHFRIKGTVRVARHLEHDAQTDEITVGGVQLYKVRHIFVDLRKNGEVIWSGSLKGPDHFSMMLDETPSLLDEDELKRNLAEAIVAAEEAARERFFLVRLLGRPEFDLQLSFGFDERDPRGRTARTSWTGSRRVFVPWSEPIGEMRLREIVELPSAASYCNFLLKRRPPSPPEA